MASQNQKLLLILGSFFVLTVAVNLVISNAGQTPQNPSSRLAQSGFLTYERDPGSDLVPCYVEPELASQKSALVAEGYSPFLIGEMANKDELEIFRNGQGDFRVFVYGPTPLKEQEGCVVASGSGLLLTSSPAPAR